MTDNNWITPEWIKTKIVNFRTTNTDYTIPEESFLAAEINKEIKNVLESAEKRDCKTCKRSQYTINCQECLACYFETKKTFPNWTPKEVK